MQARPLQFVPTPPAKEAFPVLLVKALVAGAATVAYKVIFAVLDHPISWVLAGLLGILSVVGGFVLIVDDD